MAETEQATRRFGYMSRVRLVQNPDQTYYNHHYPRGQIAPGSEGYVTRMGTNSALVRFPIRGEERSVWIEIRDLEPVVMDPNAPAPRRLGEKPEGDEFIGPDHPGLQWLWEDAARVADQYGHCREYDQIADKLSIPGRVRTYTVKVPLVGDGVSGTVSVKVESRSRKEAENQANEMLSNAKFDQAGVTVSGG